MEPVWIWTYTHYDWFISWNFDVQVIFQNKGFFIFSDEQNTLIWKMN